MTIHRSSFSQHNLFSVCPKSWYYSAILKVLPDDSDMSNANAGTCVHKALEKYYSGTKSTEEAKTEFEFQWKKFNLENTKLRLEKDSYWVMVLNGITLQKQITSTELKIFYPEVVAFLDALCSQEDEIIDWKTSTRREENEHEYKKQLQLYSWLFFRKFGRLPKKSTVYYLKYTGTKGELSFNFSMDDIFDIEKWFLDILQKMEYYILHPTELPDFNHNIMFPMYRSWWDKGEGNLNYVLHIFGNHIQLQGPITDKLEKGIKNKFSYELKNAHWIKKSRPMANTTIHFWNSTNKTLPLGFRDALITTLQHYAEYTKKGLSLDIQEHRTFDKTIITTPDKFVNGKELRSYQKDAVDIYLRRKVGILEIGTGGGKTEIAIEIIRRLGCKTLFIVDKIELLRQTKQRIEESLGIEVGTIGAGNDTIKDITVATIQTLNKRTGQYASFLSGIRFAVFDETHKVAAQSYVKISRYLTGTEYRLGLSGTAFRDDGNDMMINAVTGYIVHQISSKTLIEQGWLVKPQVLFIKDYMDNIIVHTWEQQIKTGLINETPNYALFYDRFITKNEFRNNKIISIVNGTTDKKILILTKLIEHGQLLNVLLPNSQHLYGATPKEEREKMFELFMNGSRPILISTISIFAEGIDIPSLDIVINAAANKGDVKTIQVLGRVLRKLEGKKNAKYIDFFDDIKFFKTASWSRRKALLREGHEVDFVENE